MKFFIDTANLDQIKEAEALGVLDGVTTNPSLMAKEGVTGRENILKHYVAICEAVEGDVSAEVIATDIDGMIKEGEELAALHPQIVVKIPMIEDGIKALKPFSVQGIRTNCTLIFSAGQALLAAKAGATYVSPFIGRLDDISTDGLGLIQEIHDIYDNYDFGTEILAASVRHTMHVIDCAKIGANNCPYKVRRFNWFLYNQNDEFDYHMNNDLGRMVLNPDVVVRSRGVMEKCSMCIQKTQKTILDAKLEGRQIKDGEFQTACSSACSNGAMTFGDINDKDSEIAHLKDNDRMYHLLESVGTKPNVMYQAKVRNT